MTTSKINPAWVSYNNLFNEGRDGYNPHRKYLPADSSSVKAAQASTVSQPTISAIENPNGYCKNERGNDVRRSDMLARLNKDLASIETITNAYAIEITKQAIEHAKQQLGIA